MLKIRSNAGLVSAFVFFLCLFPGPVLTISEAREPAVSPYPNFDALWNYGDPQGTEKAFREILATVEGKAGNDYVAQLLTQIARTWRGSLCNNLGWTYFDLERYQNALEMFEQHLAVRTEEEDAEQMGVVHGQDVPPLRTHR